MTGIGQTGIIIKCLKDGGIGVGRSLFAIVAI